MGGKKGTQRLGQELGQRVGVGQDADLAAKATAVSAKVFMQPLGLPQNGARMLEQGAAGRGRGYALAPARE